MAEKTGRKNQPKCGDCSHPISFHGGGQSRCKALGCHCQTWVAPAEQPEDGLAPTL